MYIYLTSLYYDNFLDIYSNRFHTPSDGIQLAEFNRISILFYFLDVVQLV